MLHLIGFLICSSKYLYNVFCIIKYKMKIYSAYFVFNSPLSSTMSCEQKFKRKLRISSVLKQSDFIECAAFSASNGKFVDFSLKFCALNRVMQVMAQQVMQKLAKVCQQLHKTTYDDAAIELHTLPHQNAAVLQHTPLSSCKR